MYVCMYSHPLKFKDVFIALCSLVMSHCLLRFFRIHHKMFILIASGFYMVKTLGYYEEATITIYSG